MIAAARHDAILRELELRGSLITEALASRMGVTGMTIRRDIADLERRGLLVRVHGGAISMGVAQEQTRRDLAGAAPRVPSRPIATIGMIVPTTNYYFPEVIRGASQAARELNCRLVVGATNYAREEELRQARRLVAAGVDALMVTPQDISTEHSELRDFLESCQVPVVLVERGVEESMAGRLEWVRSDHVHGAEVAVRHLAEQGHHRLALAARPAATVSSLQEGFKRAVGRLDAAGHSLVRDLAMPGAGDNVTLADIDAFLDDCLDQDITAAVILGDTDSMAFTDRAIERGLQIPEDFAVIAYDDEVSAFAAVPLTAIAPPKRELGHAAVRLCFDRLAQAVDAPHTIVRMILLPALVVRDSTVRSR